MVHLNCQIDWKEELLKGKSCLEIKAIREKARAETIAENIKLQRWAVFTRSKEAAETHESKMTNTEEVNKGIYFSYPSRRHSCALVNIPSPCVNKVISHIEDMDSKIQDHLKKFETSFEEWSRTSAPKDEKGDLRITEPKKEVHSEEARDEKCPELKKEMEALLSEAIHLIKTLETDRAEAEQALKQQNSRKKRISMKIDSWSIWKLQELPSAVQKEHEAYLKDIVELRCHLEERAQKLEKLEGQKAMLEETNAMIQKDIDYMQHHAPLLEAKRKQELEALEECYHKKTEAVELFKRVHEELEDSIEDYENVKTKLKQLKEESEKDLCEDETSIDTYKKEINTLSSVQAHYSTSIEDVTVHIDEDEGTMTEVLRETQSTTNKLTSLQRTADDLKRMFDQYSWKQKNLEKKYLEALNNYYVAKKSWDIELADVSKDLTAVSTVYLALREENKRLLAEIDDVTEQVSESIKKKVEYESEIQSLLEMKIKNKSYLKQFYKQAYHIGAIYHIAKHKTDDIEDQIAEVRRQFKGREEFLKKRTRGKMAAGIEIQKRLYSIEDSQFTEMQNFLRRKALFTLALLEIELPLRQIEADAMRIKILHREHSNQLNEMRQKKELVKKRVEATNKKLRRKGKKSLKELTKTEGRRSLIHQEIESNRSKTIFFNAKSQALSKELRPMRLEKINYEEKLEKLKEEFTSIKFKKEHAQEVFDHFMREKQFCEERLSEEDRRFQKLMALRQNTLANIRKLQDDSLKENLRLAQEYQKMQMIFLKEKETYFSGYSRWLSLSASICDKKQICELQRRMDKQWQEYSRLVILFYQNRLAKFQSESQEGVQKILAVQEESSYLIQNIVDFFQTLTDGPCESDG
ncbi:coiled-coil domain-containing protein 178 [Nannospalax galili]|uniref:coiled-coil domain-containing protein 178 n=1 Tax=Nannospalax galili TaxID=1026970 RepID=UPI0004ED1691|nr:coiled-coil domain-containing protein 178 [Nannospalax galili]